MLAGSAAGLALAAILAISPSQASATADPARTGPAQAQPAQTRPVQIRPVQIQAAPGDPTVLERSFYKTLVFEGATNTIDLLLFGSVLGGHLYAGPAFLAVNATAAALLYYGHEVAWGLLGPAADEYDVKDNILKGITFRLASSTRAFAVGYGFTRSPLAAGGFMVGSAVGETAVYVASEFGWEFYDRHRERTAATTQAGLFPAALRDDQAFRRAQPDEHSPMSEIR